jgi:hypothetical protein
VLGSFAGAMDSVELEMAGTVTSEELPVAGSAPSQDRVRVRMSVGNWLRGRSRTSSPGPHLPFIALCDGGPPTISGWAPPIRAREGRPKRPLGLMVGDQNLTGSSFS